MYMNACTNIFIMNAYLHVYACLCACVHEYEMEIRSWKAFLPVVSSCIFVLSSFDLQNCGQRGHNIPLFSVQFYSKNWKKFWKDSNEPFPNRSPFFPSSFPLPFLFLLFFFLFSIWINWNIKTEKFQRSLSSSLFKLIIWMEKIKNQFINNAFSN